MPRERVIQNISDDPIAIQSLHNLKVERVKRRLSATQLAAIAGLSASIVYQAENHPENCSVFTYSKLAAVLNWPVYCPITHDNPQQPFLFDTENNNSQGKRSHRLDNTVSVSFDLDKDLHREIKAVAEARNLNLKECLQKAIRLFLFAQEDNNDH